MDPFTLATGIAGILGLAGTVLASCYQYGCGVADAPRELQRLANEITTLTGVLVALKASIAPEPDIDGLPPSYYQTKFSDGQAAGLKEAMNGCEQALNEVNEHLKRSRADPTKRFESALRRLKWPLTQKDTMDVVGRLERYKVTFNTAIGVETLDTVRDIRNELHQSKREQETYQSGKYFARHGRDAYPDQVFTGCSRSAASNLSMALRFGLQIESSHSCYSSSSRNW